MRTTENEHQWMNLGEAARYLGPTANTQKVWRIVRNGTVARNGERIRLQHRRVGRHLCTTAAWIDEYLLAVNNADLEHFKEKETGTVAVSERVKTALVRLESAGFKTNSDQADRTAHSKNGN